MAHVELLSSYSTRDVIELFRSNPLFETKALDSSWFEDDSIDLETHKTLLDSMTKWLFSRSMSPDRFIDNMFQRFTSGENASSRFILRSYLPLVPKFYATKDVRKLCLDEMPKRQTLLGDAKVISGKEENGVRQDWMVLNIEAEKRFSTNYMRWISGLIRYAPCFLNSDAFEKVNILAYQNTFQEALDGQVIGLALSGDQLIINSKKVGHQVSFGDCIKESGLTWENEADLNTKCIYIDENVIDPVSGCVLLNKGSYYGAPVNLVEVSYKAGVVTQDPFSKLMSSIVNQEFDVWKPIQRSREELLNALNDTVNVVYYKSDDSISVNDRHLMRNVPARILRNLLREYTKTGREEYENREFKRDPEICMDPLRPNFESRLNRVVTHLKTVSQYFEIERHRRGGFRFIPKCRISFHEE